MTRIVLLLGLLCLAPARQQALSQPIGVAWNPRTGDYLVLDENGSLLQLFDPDLVQRRSVFFKGHSFDAVTAYAARWLLHRSEAEGGGYFIADLDPAVKPAILFPYPGARPETLLPAEVRETSAPAAGGRLVAVDPATGTLFLSPAPWESPGEIVWGPGWATVRFRSPVPMGPYLEWRDAAGQLRRSRVTPDRRDPMLQRAYLEPVAPNRRIELRHRNPYPRFPEAEWTPWVPLSVPKVEPAGPRPVKPIPGARDLPGGIPFG